MGMGIKSSRVGEIREIPAPSDSYQIYSNLQIIEFTIIVTLPAGYYFISFSYHLYAFVQISTCLLFVHWLNAHIFWSYFFLYVCRPANTVQPVFGHFREWEQRVNGNWQWELGMGMMCEETWELHGKWECSYGNVREWELETHSRSPLVFNCFTIGRM